MDDALAHYKFERIFPNQTVLILVVMDDALALYARRASTGSSARS